MRLRTVTCCDVCRRSTRLTGATRGHFRNTLHVVKIRRTALGLVAALAIVVGLATPAAAADTTPPTIVGSTNPVEPASGWFTAADLPVTVHFECDDVDSGVQSCTNDTDVDDEGTTVISGEAIDNENNVATAQVEVNIDTEGPIVQLVGSGVQNKAGYYLGPVTVHATCFDGLSGVAVCPADVVVAAEGLNNVVMQAEDNAGNTTDAQLNVTIDSTGPTIAPTINGTAGDNGWFVSPVTITYACADAGSGVRKCQGPSSYRGDGVVTLKAAASDNLGRTTTINVGPIKVDKAKPKGSIKQPARKGIAPNATIQGSASDSTSGVDTVEISFDGGAPVAVTLMCQGGGKVCTWTVPGPAASGNHTAAVTVTDKAGNTFTSGLTTFKTL